LDTEQAANQARAATLPCPAPAADIGFASVPQSTRLGSGQAGAWPWWLGRHPLLALTATLVVWGLVDVRSRGRIEPGNLVEHRTDFTVYTEAGAACFDGRDPYAVTNARGWGYLYPPLFAILVAPLSTLDPQWQVTVWFFVSLLLLWGCYRESTLLVDWLAGTLRRWDRCPRGAWPAEPDAGTALGDGLATRPPNWLPWAAATAAALPTLNCLQRGQVGLVQLYLLLVGFRLLVATAPVWRLSAALRAALAGLILALAVVIKVTAALPVGLVLVERFAAARRHRSPAEPPRAGNRQIGITRGLAAGLAAGLALWLVLVPAWAIGWQRTMDCLARWCCLVPTKAIDTGPSLFAGDSYSVRNQSLVNSARHLGNWIAEEVAGGGDSLRSAGPNDPPRAMDSPAANLLLLGARLTVLTFAVLTAVWAGRQRDPLATASSFALGLVASLVVSPVARTHYFLLIAPAVLLVPWYLHRAGRTRLAWWMAWTPTVLVAPHYLWPSAAGRVGWLGIGIAAWLISGGVWSWLAGRKQSGGPSVLSWRETPPVPTDRSARYRAAAASCVAGGFDPSEN
jgi:hypothetical protein